MDHSPLVASLFSLKPEAVAECVCWVGSGRQIGRARYLLPRHLPMARQEEPAGEGRFYGNVKLVPGTAWGQSPFWQTGS